MAGICITPHVELVRGALPRLVVEDRHGETHEIEITPRTADAIAAIGCDSCTMYDEPAPCRHCPYASL